MTLKEARQIGANPSEHPTSLKLARLKLEVAALRSFPSSPHQRELRELIGNIETMPREMWEYHPD